MIRCVRLWTGEDQNSHAEKGWIELEPGTRGDLLSDKLATSHASFQETRSGGTLDFWTRGDQHFTLKPGDILLAEDTAGGGSWKLVADRPWRRVYLVLGEGAAVPFKKAQ